MGELKLRMKETVYTVRLPKGMLIEKDGIVYMGV